jgi:hypothetical protein
MTSHKKILSLLTLGIITLNCTACVNMPTNPIAITPTYVSEDTYKSYSCHDLLQEKTSLSDQQNNLTFAQNARIKSSKEQAFWMGFGQGDGIAAPELAEVKGKLAAINDVIQKKHCQNK